MGGLIRWPVTRYAVALGSVAAAFLLARSLNDQAHPSAVPLFLVAVIVSVTVGGPRAGMLATILSLGASAQLMYGSAASQAAPEAFSQADVAWLVSFLIVAMSYALLSRARTRAEAQLRDRDVRLRLVSEQIPAGLWSTDANLRLTSRFGSGPHGADVVTVLDALPRGSGGVAATADEAENYPPVAAHLRALRGESSSYELAHEGRTFQCHVEPLRNGDGAIIGVVGVALEITERKEAEDRLIAAKRVVDAATQAKDQFLAMLSHELRTPLTPALAAASALERRTDLPEAVREDLEMIRRNVELQARLIDDLLDLTRISRGKMQLQVQICDAHELVRSALAICQADLAAKQLEVALDLSAGEHVVRADAARLQQVFWNLIKNAGKFTPAGGRITIRSRNVEKGSGVRVQGSGAEGSASGASSSSSSSLNPEPPTLNPPRSSSSLDPEPSTLNPCLVVEVIDTGIGIDLDVLPRIFNQFEQGRDAITHHFGGLGLGLSISKSLIDAHGGTISASSAGRDRGATFAVALEVVPAPKPAIAALAPPAEPEPASEPVAAADGWLAATPRGPRVPVHPAQRSLRILLVEDHHDTLRTMTRLLRGLGHTVVTATTLDDALSAATAGDGAAFDLIISDIGLPDGSGLDLMRRLTGRRPVKGIALSGFGMDADIRQSREAGFATHLTKPIDIRRLEAAIEQVGGMEEEQALSV